MIISLIYLVVLIWGSGTVTRLLLRESKYDDFVTGMIATCAYGMATLAFTGYFLAQFHLFTKLFAITAFICLSILLIGIVFRTIRQCKFGARLSGQIAFSYLLDLLLLILVGPTIFFAGISPIIAGDGLYSFNTWAMHWALRSDMSTYYWQSYGQLMPIVASWVYKLGLPWHGGIPNAQYILHAFYAFTGLLCLLIIKRTIALFLDHWIGSMIGFLCALLFFLQQDFSGELTSGAAEPIALLFEAFILYQILSIYKIQKESPRFSIGLGLLIAGLMFIKPSVVPVSVFFIAFFHIIVFRNVHARISTEQKSKDQPISLGYPIRHAAALSAIPLIFVVVLCGPFYLQQQRIIGNTGYSNPINQSFDGGVIDSAKLAADDMNKTIRRASGTTSSIGYFLYRISEVFMQQKNRMKPFGDGLGWPQICLIIGLVMAFMASCRYVWLLPLHTMAIIHTVLWYIYASWGYYDLLPGMLIFLVLAGLGLTTILAPFNKTYSSLCNF